jgi:hypothetical protein
MKSLNETTYWPNNPLFLFQFMFLPMLISVIDMYVIPSFRDDIVSSGSMLVFFISLITLTLVTHKATLTNGVVSGPGEFRIVSGVDIPINEAEYYFKKKFAFIPYFVIKHKNSNKEIHLAIMDFTSNVINDLKRQIDKK